MQSFFLNDKVLKTGSGNDYTTMWMYVLGGGLDHKFTWLSWVTPCVYGCIHMLSNLFVFNKTKLIRIWVHTVSELYITNGVKWQSLYYVYFTTYKNSIHLKREFRTIKPPPKKCQTHTCCQPCPPWCREQYEIAEQERAWPCSRSLHYCIQMEGGKEEQIATGFFLSLNTEDSIFTS